MSVPAFACDYAALALIAAHLRDQRAAGDPALIEQGTMKAEDAADRLRVASAIARDWQAIATGEARPEAASTARERLTMLEQALPTAQRRRNRAREGLMHGPAFYHDMTIGGLWSLSDNIDAFSEDVRRKIAKHVQPYLNAISVAAAIEAMLWWETRATEGRGIWDMIAATARMRSDVDGRRMAA